MTAPGHQVGALADEAGQLLEAVAARLDRMKAARDDGVRPVGHEPVGDEQVGDDQVADEPVSGEPVGPPPVAPSTDHTCVGWCPICRGAELLRGDRTEVSDRLLDTAILVVGTLRSLLPQPSSAPATPDQTSATPDQTGSAPRPGVERIDIR